jgi:hypothetical protein
LFDVQMGGQRNSSGWTLHQWSFLERCAHPLNPSTVPSKSTWRCAMQSQPCQENSSGASPGIKVPKRHATSSSKSRREFRCISVTSLTMATGFERKHKRTAASVSSQEHRPFEALGERSSQDLKKPKRTSAEDTRLYDAMEKLAELVALTR